MKIAIVGSRGIAMTGQVEEEIGRLVDNFRPGDTLLVRSPDGERVTSAFESRAASLAAPLGVNVRYSSPVARDRASLFRRDYALVEQADEVLAYFPYDTDLDGGTWHVIHAAMQKGVPCRAYTITQDGRTKLIGSEDGSSMFDDADAYAFV